MLPFPVWLVPVPALSVPEALSRYGAKFGIVSGPGGATMSRTSARAHPMEPHVREMHPEDHGRLVHLHGFKRLAAGGQLNADTVNHWLAQVLGTSGSGAAAPLVNALDDRNAVLTFPSVGLAGRALDSLTPDVIDKYAVPFQLRLWGVGVPAVLQGVPVSEINEEGEVGPTRVAPPAPQEGTTVIRGWGGGSRTSQPAPQRSDMSVAQRVSEGLARERNKASSVPPPNAPASGSSWSRAASSAGGGGAWGRGGASAASSWRTAGRGSDASTMSTGATVIRARTGARRMQDTTRGSGRGDAW